MNSFSFIFVVGFFLIETTSFTTSKNNTYFPEDANIRRGYEDYGHHYQYFPYHQYHHKPKYKLSYKDGDVYEIQKFAHYGYKKLPHFKKHFGIGPLLAFLAPIATIPVIAGAAFTTLAATTIPLAGGLAGAGLGRRRRDAVAQALVLSSASHPSLMSLHNMSVASPQEMDSIQKYLKKMRPDGDYNEEVVATYLRCSGMLDEENQCLERLVCQFSDTRGGMAELEKEVASLIIYSILTNKHIDLTFKSRLRKAALTGRDGGCGRFVCIKGHSMPSRSRG